MTMGPEPVMSILWMSVLFNALHDRGQDLVLLFGILLEDRALLRLADALHDDLLRGLRCDAAEFLRIRFLLQHVADLEEGVDLPRRGEGDLRQRIFNVFHNGLGGPDLDLTGFAVEIGADVAVRIIIFLVGTDQRRLDRVRKDVDGDAAFFADQLQGCDELGIHL